MPCSSRSKLLFFYKPDMYQDGLPCKEVPKYTPCKHRPHGSLKNFMGTKKGTWHNFCCSGVTWQYIVVLIYFRAIKARQATTVANLKREPVETLEWTVLFMITKIIGVAIRPCNRYTMAWRMQTHWSPFPNWITLGSCWLRKQRKYAINHNLQVNVLIEWSRFASSNEVQLLNTWKNQQNTSKVQNVLLFWMASGV